MFSRLTDRDLSLKRSQKYAAWPGFLGKDKQGYGCHELDQKVCHGKCEEHADGQEDPGFSKKGIHRVQLRGVCSAHFSG